MNVINNRYHIDPTLHQVMDLHSGKTTHLEPRVMAVLDYLTQRAGQLVSREDLVRDIWHNYGGGDEALSQAISLLRKVLNDREKNLIQTIPKKGYRLTTECKTPNKRPVLPLLLKVAVVLYIIGTIAYFFRSQPAPRTLIVYQPVKSRPLPVAKRSPVRYHQAAIITAPAILPIETKTQHYYSSDTTAQMITSLDYTVSTTLQYSTTIN